MLKNKQPEVIIKTIQDGITGSCNIVRVKNVHPKEDIVFLVDYGSFQGGESYKNFNDLLKEDYVDFVLLTHGHLDHTGLLPLLKKIHFNGPIFCSNLTKEILPINLSDNYNVLKKNNTLLYRKKDIDDIMKNVISCQYNKEFKVCDGLSIHMLGNGHLPGASMFYVEIYTDYIKPINLLFTGDYKGTNSLFEVPKIPEKLLKAPVTIITEATHGLKMKESTTLEEEKSYLKEAIQDEKALIFPTFSLGRTQEVLLMLKELQEEIPMENIPIFLDGSTAQQYTQIFATHFSKQESYHKNFIPENMHFISNYYSDRNFKNTINRNKSEMLNCQKIYVCSSGNATNGISNRYVKNFINNENYEIIFTGYLHSDSFGQFIYSLDENEHFLVDDIEYIKRAKTVKLDCFSGHATFDELLQLINSFNTQNVIITHGEPQGKKIFLHKMYRYSVAESIIDFNSKSVLHLNKDGEIIQIR